MLQTCFFFSIFKDFLFCCILKKYFKGTSWRPIEDMKQEKKEIISIFWGRFLVFLNIFKHILAKHCNFFKHFLELSTLDLLNPSIKIIFKDFCVKSRRFFKIFLGTSWPRVLFCSFYAFKGFLVDSYKYILIIYGSSFFFWRDFFLFFLSPRILFLILSGQKSKKSESFVKPTWKQLSIG